MFLTVAVIWLLIALVEYIAINKISENLCGETLDLEYKLKAVWFCITIIPGFLVLTIFIMGCGLQCFIDFREYIKRR